MYKKILVPVDNSATSRAALKEAKRFAKNEQAAVRLVHVIDLAQFAWSANEFLDVPRLQASLREGGQAVLNESAAAMKDAGVEPESAMLETWSGIFSDIIIDDALAWKADLIIMGTHGYSGLKHVLLGSVAEGVIRQSPVPVLLVKMKAEPGASQ